METWKHGSIAVVIVEHGFIFNLRHELLLFIRAGPIVCKRLKTILLDRDLL